MSIGLGILAKTIPLVLAPMLLVRWRETDWASRVVGLALIALGVTGWFLRHGPLSEQAVAPAAAMVETKQLSPGVDRGSEVYVSSSKTKSNVVKVKRRQKKAKTRSKHVQR